MGRPAEGYKNAAGKRIPGTTTIIGRFKESGALLQWAFKQGQSGVATLYQKRDEAATAGQLAHDMIEAHILGKSSPDSMVDEAILTRATNAFNQFREWQDQSRIEVIETERSYVSEALQFGGTVDAIGRDTKDRIVLIDWKTSNSVYSDYLLQLAAYQILLEECSEWRPQGFHLLRVAKESADFAHYFYGELEDAKQAFILMRQLYSLDLKLRERCK